MMGRRIKDLDDQERAELVAAVLVWLRIASTGARA